MIKPSSTTTPASAMHPISETMLTESPLRRWPKTAPRIPKGMTAMIISGCT